MDFIGAASSKQSGVDDTMDQEETGYTHATTAGRFSSKSFNVPAKIATEWLPSVPTASQWPSDAYAASPLSPRASGLNGSSKDDPWTFFDGDSFREDSQLESFTDPAFSTFGATTLGYAPSVPAPTWNSNMIPDEVKESPSSFLPLSAISTSFPTPDEEDDDDEEQGPTPNSTSQTEASSVSSPATTPQSSYKPAWGVSRPRRPNPPPSRSSRTSTSTKSSTDQSSDSRRRSTASSTTSSAKSRHLRSTRQGQRISFSSATSGKDATAAGGDDTSKHSRMSHNLVEKQYRVRLNGQFETLLEAIPKSLVEAEVEGYGEQGALERRVSKGEVLVLARRYIESLEKKHESLEADKRALMGDVQKLKRAWVKLGGTILS